MQIKHFGLDAPRAAGMMARILQDIERRLVFPQLDLRYYTDALRWPVAPGKVLAIPSLSCLVGDEGYHAAIVDKNPESENLTVLLTHTTPAADGTVKVGFKTEYEAPPSAAVYVSFDWLQFFLHRAEHLNVKQQLAGHEDEWAPNLLYRKTLEVENVLKAAYPELPEAYTWKANIEARKPDGAPVVEFHR